MCAFHLWGKILPFSKLTNTGYLSEGLRVESLVHVAISADIMYHNILAHDRVEIIIARKTMTCGLEPVLSLLLCFS